MERLRSIIADDSVDDGTKSVVKKELDSISKFCYSCGDRYSND
jgi:hypothetical protein